MALITALSAQKRNAERVNVYLDGQFAFGLALIAVQGLRLGQELSEAEIDALKALDEVEKAKDIALGILVLRPRSTAEVRRHLRKKGYDESVCEEVIARLTRVHLIDDAAFASYWVDQRETFRPRSHLALRQELQQKGVSRELIDAAIETVDEEVAARHLADKKAYRWAHLPEDAFNQKLMTYLNRQGFSYTIIKQTTQDVWETISAGQDSNAADG